MTAVAAQDILAAWERLCLLPRTTHWDARNSALLDALGVTAARDTAGARQAALLELHASNFGDRLDGVAVCPGCGTEVELNVPVAELVSGMPSPEPVEPFDVDGVTVRWRLPGGADLALSARCADPAQGAVLLLERISGAGLSGPVRAALAQRVAAADPFADITFDFACPDCETTWESPLDVGDFVWARLRSTARRLLGEVDELARAYGWSEGQVLALSQQRRNSYLELVRHG
ncbi:MAG TPA: hypothetical protein VFC19_47035 [Candidatus Limnocylindrales bacterium]|nr:hypothetical protein [Candidatus Limnocylindrales bacterium]